MDAFFASVEQHDHPELRGLPIAVGHDGPRGVVATASYEARRYGVHSAQAVATARRLCPQLTVVRGNYSRYKEVSAQMHDIFHEYTDLVEPISLDEAFLDVTENKPGMALAVDIAREIKDKIRSRLGLTASAGVSYCKLLAKIASDMRKPDGLTTIHPLRAEAFLATLPVEKLWGVGPRTAEALHAMGIVTCGDLRQRELPLLASRFGKMGVMLHEFARGIDERPVEPVRERKSLSCEQTYPTDLTTAAQLDMALLENVDELLRRLERKGFEGHTLTLKVKFSDFHQITRIGQLHTLGREEVVGLARRLLEEAAIGGRGVRLMGLGVGGRGAGGGSGAAAGGMAGGGVTAGHTHRTVADVGLLAQPWPPEAVAAGARDGDWRQLVLEFEPW